VTAAGICVAACFFIAASVTMFAYEPNATAIPIINGSVSPSHRAIAWKTSFETFLEDPVFGRGIGMPVAYSKFIDPSGGGQILTDAHNTYLSLLAESGILGFAAFMSIIAFLTFGLIKMRGDEGPAKYVRLFFLLALFDAFFYQSLTGSYEDSRHLWAFFGYAAAAINIFGTENS
jgi:O-antigen ligase